jgi:hypothetical protein
VAVRFVASAIAVVLLAWSGLDHRDATLLLYGPLSTAPMAALPRLRRSPVAWALDCAVTLALVIESGDWRSAYYMLWLAALALPAAHLPLRQAAWLALGAPLAFLLVAIWGGPAPGRLEVVSTETLAIHLSLPMLLVASLAYVRDALRRLSEERHSASGSRSRPSGAGSPGSCTTPPSSARTPRICWSARSPDACPSRSSARSRARSSSSSRPPRTWT